MTKDQEMTALPYFKPGDVIVSREGVMGTVDKASWYHGEWCYILNNGGLEDSETSDNNKATRIRHVYVPESGIGWYRRPMHIAWQAVDDEQRKKLKLPLPSSLADPPGVDLKNEVVKGSE